MTELYSNFVDDVYKKNIDLNDAMKDELTRLLIEFSTINGSADEIKKEADKYTEIIMQLIYETRYEW